MAPAARSGVWLRYRFQPVFGIWGHLGLDYSFEDPNEKYNAEFRLRHLDYGLPGDRAAPGYLQCIGRYCAMVAPNGLGWPPLRTPRGRFFVVTAFTSAPRRVGEFLIHEAPCFWGGQGAYQRLGPNSNTGLRRTLELCEKATGFCFPPLPRRFRVGGWGWGWRGPLEPTEGPYPGYSESAEFRPAMLVE